MDWIQAHWLNIIEIVWSADQLLKIIAKITPSKIDDNIADIIGKYLAKFFPAPK